MSRHMIKDHVGNPRLEVYTEKGRLCLRMMDYGLYVVNFDQKIIPHLIKALKKVQKDLDNESCN
jgi:hypothetical protein